VKSVAVLGSTGSIGTQTLEVIRNNPGRWRVTSLAAGRRVQDLFQQIQEFAPDQVVVADEESRTALAVLIGSAGTGQEPTIEVGATALEDLARTADIVMNGLVGATGLRPTLAAVKAGKRLALANKESLVLAGELVMSGARESGAEILPVDSEHSGLFQCFSSGQGKEVHRVILTASGGPLRNHPDWRRATPAEVLNHPIWSMGSRITTDSATLVNKGLEVIEAHWLFDLAYGQIDIVVHPQAAIHAFVEWSDGSIVSQISVPDMRLPIQLALSWPQRLSAPIERFDFAKVSRFDFSVVAGAHYPCLELALQAGRQGGLAPTVFNAADEVAVELFHAGHIQLGDLPEILERVLESHEPGPASSLAAIEMADEWAREETRRIAVRV